ncbi:MAG: tyrosine-type recombinase/integrase [bacterium]|nr:tyrosine-type recombinase/integrase [bacterium]
MLSTLLGRAIEQFLAAKPLCANGRRCYAHTLGTVVGDLGADVEQPSHRCGVVSRLGTGPDWIAEDPLEGIERRPQVRDDTAPIRYEELHALWTRPDVQVREKTLWRMLYETAARANEILALNVEDLDIGARRAVVRGNGGHRQEVVWASGAARLLPAIWAVGVEGRCSSPTSDPTWAPDRFSPRC